MGSMEDLGGYGAYRGYGGMRTLREYGGLEGLGGMRDLGGNVGDMRAGRIWGL